MSYYPETDPATGLIQTVVSQQALKVLRNAYTLLAITMVPTIVGAMLSVSWLSNLLTTNPQLIARHSTMFMLGFVAVWLVSLGLMFAIQKNANSSLAVYLLLVYTFIMGALLAPILMVALSTQNGFELIAYAAGTTALIFFSLASYVTITGKDFSGLGKFLFTGMMIVLVALIANIFFQIPAFSLAVSGAVVLLMSMYILYDISRIIHGGEKNYVVATLGLYITIYNLFIHLLRIMIILSGGRQ